MKKVLIVTQYFWPENFKINDLANGFIERGIDVTVLTGIPNYPQGRYYQGYSLKGPYKEKYGKIKIIRVPLISRGPKKGLRLVLNYLSFVISGLLFVPFLRGKFNGIFVYGLSPITLVIPAILIKHLKKLKIYFWLTDLWPESLVSTNSVKNPFILNLVGRLVSFIYKNCDYILVSSRGFIPKVASYGVSNERIKFFPQWPESLFTESAEDDQQLRNSLPNGFKILFAGNLGTAQSIETLVEAAILTKENNNIKWVVIGDGIQRSWLENEIKEKKLEKTVILLRPLPLNKMPSLYRCVDVLYASLREDPLFEITIPTKIQGYLTSGRPVIASMAGEPAAIIRESGSGLTPRPSSGLDLARAALEIYGMTEEERAQMGENGAKYCKEHFNRERLINFVVELMEK